MSSLNFKIQDAETKQPIEAVTVQLVKDGKAAGVNTISNSNGMVNLALTQNANDVLISHVAYGAFVMPIKDFAGKTILELKIKSHELNEFNKIAYSPSTLAKMLFGGLLAIGGVKYAQHKGLLPNPLFKNLNNKKS